ncbi:ATP-binding cassette, subfamily B [Parafrankia irregularis]|uniref:ATP-binding cassette, subfamily B n=1 Tax=Parafrankia irregularis TaxID=795642 RepID=A0A0S4R0T0_9ACTN|nr:MULTISPECIES: ABC transporter ATP-binding protein [Parafrankia]MBE3204877.1 ABC transporter ATP-binding protein [Parafrankia sp. CH37]CUU60648.1 ATP-binding cassette, subfamily B [Parafrankia irregularis]
MTPARDVPGTHPPGADAAAAPGWLRGLWGFLLLHRRDLALAWAAALLGSACQAVVPLIARHIVDDVIVARTSPLWPWLLLLLAAAAGAFGFAYVRRYRGGRVALGVQFDLRNAMHDHLQTLDQDNLSRLPTGQLVARANSDSALVQGLLSLLPIMMGNVLMLIATLIIMIFLSPPLALISLAVVPTLFALSYRLRSRVFPATWDAQQREGGVAQIVDEDVNGVRVVKAFGQERRELDRIVDAAGDLYGSRMRAVRLRARYQPLLEAVPAFAQVAILAVGGWMALNGHLTIGTFLAFSTYVGQFAAPARQLAGVLTVGQQARAGVERIFQLLRLTPTIADAPDAVDLGPLRGEIAFEGVEFAYRADVPILRGFDLRIAAGERVAIIGASGSGKSTVAALLSRFHDPDAGRVTVDGHDLRSVRLRSLRSQVGVAFEESFLFSASVRENIAFGRPDASEAEVEAAARAAAAHDFIVGLPRGYDTVVGERGLSLSGGQRQRIALARALLTDPRVLVLDDATSAVDAHTEERIHDALRELLPGRTTILIAHRVSTLHLADRIVVIDGGRVVESGTHDELQERSGTYRALLAGLDAELADELGDRVEVLATLLDENGTESVGEYGTASAGETETETENASAGAGAGAARVGGRPRPRRPAAAGVAVGAPSLGAGLGGGGGWRMNLTPTPELLARVAALPPVRDVATVDLAVESQPDPEFSLLRLLRRFRRPLLVGLLLVIGDAAAGLAGPVLVKTGVDSGVAEGSSAVLWAASAVFLLVTLADLLDQIAETFVTGRAAERIMLSLRIRIFAQLQRLSLDYYEREMSGRVMTRMTTDVDQFESLIENGLLAALVSVVTFGGVGAALLSIDLELGGLTLLVIVPLAAATVVFRRRAAALYDVARERIAIVNADFQESLSGIREAQSFVHETATIERFHGLGRDYLRARLGAQRLVAIYFPFVQFLSSLADAIVLGVGSALIANGQLSVGALIAFILYIDMFFSPIQQLSQVFDAWQQTRVSVARIAELMRLRTLTPEPRHPVDPPGRPRGELTLDGLRFAYPAPPTAKTDATSTAPKMSSAALTSAKASARARKAERKAARLAVGPADPRFARLETAAPTRPPEALRGVDLRVAPGETVALVGETGAGKSTVLKLIARFYDPDEGAVRLDGLDLRALDLGTFRRWLGYVPQEAFLFSGSIRDNIAYGRPEASDAEVEAAARAVGAHELIVTLPGGYDHEVAERGRSLSSGQRQLLALARAELVDPVLLLLDEATSNLDLATEHRVTTAMQRVARSRTTIVIAHRLQTARTADRIVVLDRGAVAEIGSHDELLEADGRYASMWRAFELVGSAAP